MSDSWAEPLRCSICQSTEHLAYQHDAARGIRVYRVYREEDQNGVTFWCPICGRLDGAVLRGHGFEHIIEDASA